MGRGAPCRPMRSGYIRNFFFGFRAISDPERQNETKSRFSSCRCAAACGSRSQRLGRHEGASAGSRGHVTSRCRCPCGSGCRDRLVAPTEMRRDREPSQVRQVIGRIATRLLLLSLFTQISPHARQRPFFACRKRQVLHFPSCLFGPRRAETKRQKPRSAAVLGHCCLFALRLPLPAHQQHQISSKCREEQREQGGRQ